MCFLMTCGPPLAKLPAMSAQNPDSPAENAPPVPIEAESAWQEFLDTVQSWITDNPFLGDMATLGTLLAVSVLVWGLTWLLVLPLLRRLIKRSRFEWDDAFLDAKTFRWLGYIPPAVVFALASTVLASDWIPLDLDDDQNWLRQLRAVAQGFIVVCVMMALNAVLTAINGIYERKQVARSRPIKGYVQISKIFVFLIGSICGVALMLGKDPTGFLVSVAGLAAVLMFVFKDTILSLVASIQLTSNDMLHVGDWIEVPSCGADGDVIDIALHTVKVQNFDKTIVTVPTQKLVDGAFKNWRGMQESGGRRIKRDLYIDMGSIRFLEDADIERFKEVKVLREYLEGKEKELEESNQEGGDCKTNFRRLTNVGTFRAYITHYLRGLPGVHGKFTFLIRQLQPGPQGLPIQLYLFTETTAWGEYEAIQADIFDHLLAVAREFDLRIFQQPSGTDLEALGAQRA